MVKIPRNERAIRNNDDSRRMFPSNSAPMTQERWDAIMANRESAPAQPDLHESQEQGPAQ
jgi:hypothetical protein